MLRRWIQASDADRIHDANEVIAIARLTTDHDFHALASLALPRLSEPDRRVRITECFEVGFVHFGPALLL